MLHTRQGMRGGWPHAGQAVPGATDRPQGHIHPMLLFVVGISFFL
jgi:hypothetical protein